MEVVLDEDVKTEQDTRALGICEGDFVCFDPRTVITGSGYIKSRFLDDKLSAAILLTYAKELKDRGQAPGRKVYLHFTVYEEVGHGAAASVPEDVEEVVSVDMGCVGEGLKCTERQVSICAKDSGGPYDYSVTTALVEAAKAAGADYAVDVYPPLRQRRRSRPAGRVRRAPRPDRRGGVRLPRVRALPQGRGGEHLEAFVAVHPERPVNHRAQCP